jgi:transposase
MGMGRKKDRAKQETLWVAFSEMVTTPGHVFYERLNAVLNTEMFDQRIEVICRKYYKSSSGRPSMTPGTYFRMLLLGYFEGIDSERGIAWRAADSLSYRKFLGYDLSEQTPDHSTVSRTRRLYSVETHRAVMKWVLKILRKNGLADAQSVCIDATTLEANVAMKSLVRRDTGVSYDDYLRQLAQAEGIENPTKEQLARLDRKRKKKASPRPFGAHYEDEGRAYEAGVQGRARSGSGVRRIAGGNGAAGRSRGHDELRGNARCGAARGNAVASGGDRRSGDGQGLSQRCSVDGSGRARDSQLCPGAGA